MGVTYTIDAPGRTAHLVLSGEPTRGQVVDALLDLLHDPGFETGFSLLIDGRGARHPDTQCVRSFITFLGAHRDELTGVRIAIVAPDPASFGMARMAQILGEHLPLRIAPFKELSSALAWIGSGGGA